MKWFVTIIPVILGIFFLYAGGSKLAGQAVRLRITLSDGDLYALKFS